MPIAAQSLPGPLHQLGTPPATPPSCHQVRLRRAAPALAATPLRGRRRRRPRRSRTSGVRRSGTRRAARPARTSWRSWAAGRGRRGWPGRRTRRRPRPPRSGPPGRRRARAAAAAAAARPARPDRPAWPGRCRWTWCSRARRPAAPARPLLAHRSGETLRCTATAAGPAPPGVVRWRTDTPGTSSSAARVPSRGSAITRSASGVPSSSDRRTSAPTIACASRNGTPSRTRYSARSVAAAYGESAARAHPVRRGTRACGTGRPSHRGPGAPCRARRTAAPCPPGGHGCRRAAGTSCVARKPVRSPMSRPALPRASSAMSGFFFWGSIDEPVA